MPELAYVNGEIMPIEKAVVSIDDRGYNFGDAVYEFIASYNHELFFVEEHLSRLKRSMEELSFPPLSMESLRKIIDDLFQKANIARAGVYIQISRGHAPRDHAYNDIKNPQIVMTIRHIREKPKTFKENGAYVITLPDLRWGRCDIKTVQLLPNVMAKQKAIDSGAFDAIFVAEDGVVREATSSNVFIVQGEAILTHPLTTRILGGITRNMIINICEKDNIKMKERFFTIDDMLSADEVFMTGTTAEVIPIISIDQKDINSRKVGPITIQLQKRLTETILDRV